MLERLGSLGELQDQMQCDRAWVEINLEALTHNVRQLKQWLAPKTDLMAVVKADAYGHGAITVARTALAAGFPVERITFHGNNKSDAELEMARDAGVGRIVVDSMTEKELDEMASTKRKGKPEHAAKR